MGAKFRDDRATDLFGNPVRPSTGRRGRPCLQVDPEDRDTVEAALARGWSNERIAKVLGISLPSLKRHFRAELQKRDEARDKLELAAFRTLAREALAGKMSAMKQLRDVLATDALRKAEAEMKRKQAEAEARGIGAQLGKKERAKIEAEQAADGWGGLLAPPTDLH